MRGVSSDRAIIAVIEGEEIKPSSKPLSVTTCFRQADIKPRIRIVLTLLHWITDYRSMVVFEHGSSHVTRQTRRSTDFKSLLLYL